MPSVITPVPYISKGNYLMGLLTIINDDHLGERYFVLERNTLAVIVNNSIPASGIVKLLIRADHATNGVIVGAIDDNKQYNAVIADGVTCELVNANTADLSP